MHREPRKRILVVDDELSICKIVVETLESSNLDIVSFNDPQEALDYLATNAVDLVLTDMIMGEHSGLQILKAANEHQSDAVVILMTAHPTVKTAISALKQGAYDFLVKPFKLELLRAAVRRGLAHQKVMRDNLNLKGQVEFLKVANAFFAAELDIDKYLHLILRSCNTELSARASAVIEYHHDNKRVERQILESPSGDLSDKLLDLSLLEQFEGAMTSKPIIRSEPMEIDGRRLYNVLISKPILVRQSLQGVINVAITSRTEQIASGQLDVLSILAYSAASAIANHRLYHDLQSSYLQAIRALANAIEARDQMTAGHTDRVTKLAEQVARYVGWDEGRLQILRMGCMLHDIGKIGVPDSILNKQSRLTEEERQQMNDHPTVGLRIIKDIPLFKPSIPYITAHHERYDGKGYPDGLKGENIPTEGRLLAVVDTFDAIMSDRPYRKGAPIEVAVGELQKHAGTQFDPVLVRAFLELLATGTIDLKSLYGREYNLECLKGSFTAKIATV